MTAVDWTLLEPHRPLGVPDEACHVARPDGGSAKLVSLVRAGANPIAVVGPMGSGKSTELMMAFRQLLQQDSHIAAIHAFDHIDAGTLPRSLDVSFMLDMLSYTLLNFVQSRQLNISSALQQKLIDAGVPRGSRETAARVPAADLLRELLREVRQAHGQKPAVLLCDGLEKYPAEKANEILDALLPFRTEATLVVGVPTSLVYGPASYDVVSNFKLFHVRAVQVRDENGIPGREGRAFLKAIVARRLDLGSAPPELARILDRAAEASGGIPRAFLQLVLDAGMYARLAQHEWPGKDELAEAMNDHLESMRRLLIKGDLDALRAADGTDGLEVEPERRLRLMTHGLLLEYKVGDRTVVHPAPLLAGLPALLGAA